MRTYTTKQGDMWDTIAFNELGNDKHMDKLMDLNRKYHAMYIFPAGIKLQLPDIMADVSSIAPPWKQVEG